ncbi:MAG: DUF4416 family protein, partial [Spirochaetaceae bacterium]
YIPEMGSPIFRIFASHERLIHPRELARVKIETNEMEDILAVCPPELAVNPPEGSEPSGRSSGAPGLRSCDHDSVTMTFGLRPSGGLGRKVNLDPGILDYDKFVLASAKYNGQKVYLDMGIWADLTLHYEKGKFDPYPWSFPDFKSRIYDGAFMEMRRLYKDRRKNKEPGGFTK